MKKTMAVKLILILSAFAILIFAHSSGLLLPAENNPRETAFASEVIDGDTFKISTGEIVRLLGINTPEEGQFYYSEAKIALESFIMDREIKLEKTRQTGTNTEGFCAMFTLETIL
ncbi:MAG: hypothetical protein V1911_04470 [Candidatus Micrarchaeota archaeon]